MSESITNVQQNILESLQNPSITLDSVSGLANSSSSSWTPALMNYPSNAHVIENADTDNPPWYYFTRTSSDIFEFFEGGHPTKPEEKVPVYFFDGRSKLSPNQLAGYMMYVQTSPGLKEWNDAESKYNTYCQVIGHSPSGATEENPYLKVLPPIPFSSMYDYSVRGTARYYSPNSIVEQLGLVGSRGETCANCIRGGRSFRDTGETYPSGDPKYLTCEPKGYFYMVVTTLIEATRDKKADGFTWDITRFELGTPDSPTYSKNGTDIVKPFICVMDVSANGLNGSYMKDQPDLTINGPRQYLAKISKDLNTGTTLPAGDPGRELGYYPMRVSTRYKINKKGGQSPRPQVHLDVDLDVDKDIEAQLKEREEERLNAIQLWKTNSPELNIEPLPPSAYSGYKGETSSDTESQEASAEVIDLDESTGEPFNFKL